VVRVPSNHWIGGSVGPRVGLDAVCEEKNTITAPAENTTPDVQLAA